MCPLRLVWVSPKDSASRPERVPLVGRLARRRRRHGVDGANPTSKDVHYLQDAIQTLPASLKVVVEGCLIRVRPTTEIASELGVPEGRIPQMLADALAMLGDELSSHLASPSDGPSQSGHR